MKKEFIVSAPKNIEFREYEIKPPADHEVWVEALVSGIKIGTEMALFSGNTPFLREKFHPDLRLFLPSSEGGLYPCNLGSWLCGKVIKIGSKVEKFRVGDLVHGGMAHKPVNVVDENILYPLAKGMKPEIALFTDPAIFALQAVHDAQIKVGDKVAIFGMGALGLLAVQFAKMNGARQVIAVDLIPDRLELAKKYGADQILNAAECDSGLEIKKLTEGKGVDVSIEISGAYTALQSAIRGTHPGGLLVTASYFKGNGEQLQLGAEWHHNRLTLISSMPVWDMPHRNFPMWNLKRIEETVLRLLETGKLQVEEMISIRFPYAKAIEAYRFIDKKPETVIKALFDYK